MPFYLHFSTFISVCVFPCYAYVFISFYNGYTLSLLYLEVKQKTYKRPPHQIFFPNCVYMPNLPNVPWEKKHETDVVWGNRRLVSLQFNISCLLQPTSTLLLIEDEHKKDDLAARSTSSAIIIILWATKIQKIYN